MLGIPKEGWIQRPIFFRGKALRYMDVSGGGGWDSDQKAYLEEGGEGRGGGLDIFWNTASLCRKTLGRC